MDHNLPVVFVRQFLTLFVRGVGFVVIMTVVALAAVLRGVWEQSDFVARAWITQLAFSRMDSRFEGSMYWAIRFTACMVMLVCLLLFSRILMWILKW
jgi:hypothetical protein